MTTLAPKPGLPPLEHPTEKEQAVFSIAMPKDKRIGQVIVGLGNLSLGQILNL